MNVCACIGDFILGFVLMFLDTVCACVPLSFWSCFIVEMFHLSISQIRAGVEVSKGQQ